MLLEAVAFPGIFALPGGSADEMHCARVRDVLLDAMDHFVLLWDSPGAIEKDIRAFLSAWSDDFRKDCELALLQLAETGRIVVLGGPAKTSGACGQHGCDWALRLADCWHPAIVVAKSDCPCCSCLAAPDTLTLNELTYGSPALRQLIDSAACVAISPKTWTKNIMESEIWVPLFRHATIIKIVDRMIGSTLVPVGNAYQLNPNFAAGLEWLWDVFTRSSIPSSGRIFEVTTGLAWNVADIPKRVKALKEFAASLPQGSGLKMDMVVKLETGGDGLGHERYLFTDQITLDLGRGVDLLTRAGRPRGKTKLQLVSRRVRTELEGSIAQLRDAR